MDLLSPGFLILIFILATSGFENSIESNDEVIDENLGKLAIANNDFAVNVYRQLTTDSTDNVFFSPLSLSTAFGMLYYGTRGETAEELRKALGYDRADLEGSLVHQTFRKYLTEILPSQDTAAYTLNSANAVLLDERLDLVSSYETEVQDYYQASVEAVDFATQGPQVVRRVNDWVKEKTNGKIDRLLEDLDASTVLVLLNAVYFKGSWKTEFDPTDTELWTFYNNGLQSGKTETDMMYVTDSFPYAEVADAQVLEMPYKGDNVSMVLLLPNEMDGLASLEAGLTSTTLAELRGRLAKKEVHVTLPKFKLEFSRELSGELQALGIREAFTPGADFSGMTASDGDVAVGQVLHKAVIEVNEEGSEAAAATGLVESRMLDLSTPYFTADHPFLFAIVDKRNDMMLFLGRVTHL